MKTHGCVLGYEVAIKHNKLPSFSPSTPAINLNKGLKEQQLPTQSDSVRSQGQFSQIWSANSISDQISLFLKISKNKEK